MGGRVAGKVGFSNGGFSDGGKYHSMILTLLYLWYFHTNDFFDDTILFRRKNRMNFQWNAFCWITGSRSYSGVNEGIMWATIIMGVIIAILISMALCYLAREKYKKRQEYYINA